MCKIFQDLCIYLVTLDILCGLNESKFNLLMEQNWHKINYWTYKLLIFKMGIYDCSPPLLYVSLRLRVQNAVSAQPCVGKIRIYLVLLNFLHCNFRLWFETP